MAIKSTLHHIPSELPKELADNISAFCIETPRLITEEITYSSQGWTLLFINEGQLNYRSGREIHFATKHDLITVFSDTPFIVTSVTTDLRMSVLYVPEDIMMRATHSNTPQQKLLGIPELLRQNDAIITQNLHLSEEVSKELHTIFPVLRNHVAPIHMGNESRSAIPLIEALVVLVLESTDLRITTLMPQTREEQISSDFLIALQQNFIEHHDVAFYADKACLSNKYFSNVISSTTRATPQEWIYRMLTFESRRQLRSTALTINEISDKLNFSSVSSFVRFFRNRMGQTPLEFRNSVQMTYDN